MVSLSTFCCGSHCLCFCAELQAVVECPITRFIGPWSHSCYPYIFEFRTRDVGLDCRYNVEGGGGGGGHNLCTDGEGMGRSRWAGTLSYAKITQSLGSIFFPRPCQEVTEKPTQHSLRQRLLRKTLMGDICIAMVIVKFHTWRHALSPSRSLQCLMAVQMVTVKP